MRWAIIDVGTRPEVIFYGCDQWVFFVSLKGVHANPLFHYFFT